MKKFIFALFCVIVWTIACLGFGYFYAKKTIKPVIIQGETVWKDKIVYKNIVTMSIEDKDKDLKHYYEDEFFLELKPLPRTNKYRIEGKLYEREAYKDFEISCGESGNWKFYAGIGFVTVIGTTLYLKTR
jgi:hypothetical protein